MSSACSNKKEQAMSSKRESACRESKAAERRTGHEDGNACWKGEPTDGQLEEMPDEELLYDLADLFKIFSDTTRIKMLYALKDQALCVADLAEAVGATQSAASHQLRILKQARLVRFSRSGKNVFYSLSDQHVHSILEQGMEHLCE